MHVTLIRLRMVKCQRTGEPHSCYKHTPSTPVFLGHISLFIILILWYENANFDYLFCNMGNKA